ncbi:MAG: helix-turn-helix transcriptional regulator [Clostridia bacterium]|nr:helix-turn-helix transcriptional regulator [Clostridia bacterium]
MIDIKNALKHNLRILREIFDLSVEDVAQKIGAADYAEIEKGEKEPSVLELLALADLYNIDMDKIVRRPLTNFFFRDAHYDCIDKGRISTRHEND